ncbi:PhnD/SsuA/transferrin family substrate-binding protein [Pantanalinema rosaneae CENA516]|uniref:PhnD/SsuA/transferrin family substrate-binding protein n=1 Tax=Pantanalinema rosaneae TaxID=1620701 RepID=UPI003D6EA296
MSHSSVLVAVSYLAPNWFPFYQAVINYLAPALQTKIELVQGVCDPLVDPLLLQDQLDLAFICGLPLMRHQQITPGQLQPIVAPVMQADRYQNRPIYCADVIVHANSRFNTFAELMNAIVCYNDPGSNSGYYLLCHYLWQHHCPPHFFNQALPSGSHQNSIRWVVEGKADCAAIDSTVLEQEFRLSPQLADQLRIITALDFCPMPPIVAAQHLGVNCIQRLRSALLQPDPALQQAMFAMQVQRYAPVNLDDYQAIARIYTEIVAAGYAL